MIARYWQQLSEKFDGLSRRERLILLFALLAVIYLLWTLAIWGPFADRKEALQAQQRTLEQQAANLQAQEQLFSQVEGGGRNASKLRQVEHLRQRLAALDKELQTLAVGLVPANMLPQVLHDVLSTAGQLELLGMQTLPVQKLALSDKNPETMVEGTTQPAGQQVNVYRHSVELKVRGSYFAVAGYVDSLEALPWRFYWDRLDYQVERYPLAVATLEVYTLSAGEGPLGE